jgi:hypothetical protein
MDRRREIRVEANEPVVITELGANRRHPMGGMIQDMSGSGMLIKLPRSIATDALIRVETSSMLLLGEVVRCEPDGEEFRVALTIRHSLQNLQALENLNRALLEAEHGMGAEQVDAGELVPVRSGKRRGPGASAPIMRE